MSDYVGELTARSLGTAEVVQPRLASRFEPAMHGGALDSALRVWSAADGPDGLAEFPPGAVALPGMREQPFAPVGIPERPSVAPGPARLSTSELEAQPSHPRRSASAQRAGPETMVTPVNQFVTKLGRFEPADPPEGHPEGIRRPAQPPNGAAASAESPDTVSPQVSQSGLPAQTPVHLPSGQVEPRLGERMKTAVDDALTPQRARRDDDSSKQADRNRAQSGVGRLPNQDARDLDERIRSTIDDVLARQRNGKGAGDATPVARHRGAQVDNQEERSAKSHTTPTREGSPPDVQPTVLTQVITQPHVTIASPVLPGSPARTTAGKGDPRQEPQPPPTIQVTIGRIEVRAISAPASAATSKPRQTPAMSLDDYLRQRNRGGQ